MKEFVPVLKQTKLFAGVEEEDVFSMLSCLGARLRTYKKGEYVLRQGQRLSDILVLAEGSLYIQKDDYWGNRSILGHIAVGEIFGEAYSFPLTVFFPTEPFGSSAIYPSSAMIFSCMLWSAMMVLQANESLSLLLYPNYTQKSSDFGIKRTL